MYLYDNLLSNDELKFDNQLSMKTCTENDTIETIKIKIYLFLLYKFIYFNR